MHISAFRSLSLRNNIINDKIRLQAQRQQSASAIKYSQTSSENQLKKKKKSNLCEIHGG